MTSRGRGRTALIWAERVLFGSGLALVLFYGAARMESWITSRAALRKIAASERAEHGTERNSESSTLDGPQNSSEALETPNVDFRLWGKQRVKAYEQVDRTQSGTPLGVLRIPKIHLEAPVFEGTDDIALNHAVGRIAGTARPGEPGNIGIAGHRDGFFRGLRDVSAGDVIELKTLQGTETYVVDQIQIVSPRQVEVLWPTAVPSLTLVTCYPFHYFGSAPQRYIVTAFLSPGKNGDSEESILSAPATTAHSQGEIK